MPFSIEKLAQPDAIALIGASSHPEKVGFQIMKNILDNGFAGQVYPVNLKETEILDKKAYPTVLNIEAKIDLAIIAIPARGVLAVLKECAVKEIPAVIVISAGFAEINGHGKAMQAEITEFCLEHNIALLGPNCLGVINVAMKLNASFANGMPALGKIALLSQSGAIISSLIDLSPDSTFGFSKIFSLGNKAVVDEADLLSYLCEDSGTNVILLYLESLKVDRHLSEILLKYAKKKPIVVLFGGRSKYGAKAASSHTGSIVTSYWAVSSYLKQAGVILAESLEELLLFGRIFSRHQRIAGENIAIITNAGGPSIAASDSLADSGLKLASLTPETKDKLKGYLRPEASINNPVDLLGDATDSDYYFALRTVESDPNVDGIIVLLTPQTSTKIKESAEVIAGFKSDKPILSSFVGGEILTHACNVLEHADKPCFSFPDEAVMSLKAIADFSLIKQTLAIPSEREQEIYDPASKEEILKKFKLPVVRYFEGKSSSEISSFAKEIGYPVVLKSADPTIHKSDEGKVELNLSNETELMAAFEKVGTPAIVGPMIKGKFELLLGIKKDDNIGTSVLFGSGGIYSEILQDFSHRIAPLTKEMALDMIMETKAGKIMNGARNQQKYDLDLLSEMVRNAVLFADSYSNIREIDFNPIIADEKEFYLVDVRIITK